MLNSRIEWTDATWNPVRGCSRVSEGCRNCYAERLAARFAGPNSSETQWNKERPFAGFVHIVNGHPAWTGKVELIEDKLTEPLKWKKPKRIFVNSMSDIFHEALPDEAIDQVFSVMALTPQHRYLMLTKRHERLLKWLAKPSGFGFTWREGYIQNAAYAINKDKHFALTKWPLPNVRLGISVEDQQRADERFPAICELAEAGWDTMVSVEPMLGPVKIPERYLKLGRKAWVIVGLESGSSARPGDVGWIRSIIKQCETSLPVFVKQLGARPFIFAKFNADPRPWPHSKCLPEHLPKPQSSKMIPSYSNGEQFMTRFFTRLNDKKGGRMEEWPIDIRVREFPEVQA